MGIFVDADLACLVPEQSVIISNALASIWCLFFILPHGHQKINLSFMVEWCPVLSFRAMTKKQTCYSRSDKSDFLEKTNNKIRQTDKLPSVELREARFWRSPLRFFWHTRGAQCHVVDLTFFDRNSVTDPTSIQQKLTRMWYKAYILLEAFFGIISHLLPCGIMLQDFL